MKWPLARGVTSAMRSTTGGCSMPVVGVSALSGRDGA
jgi:hypothetical protein